VIDKAVGQKLGMVIKGGLQGQPGNPDDPSDEGVFISKINEGGCIFKDYSEKLLVSGNEFTISIYVFG
jgi:protein scribble